MATTGAARAATAITAVRPAPVSVTGLAFAALGTFGSLLVSTPGVLEDADRILSAELQAIDLACSRFRPDSEISALNAADGRAVPVSPLFAEAIDTALTAAAHRKPEVTPFATPALTTVTCVLGIPPVQVIVRSLERSIGVVRLGGLVHTNGVVGTSIDVVKAPTSLPPDPVTV